MTDSQPEPQLPSLIQQRLVLQRKKSQATYQLVIMAVLTAGWIVVLALDGNEVFRWISVAVFAILTIISAFLLRKALRDTRDFEQQNGADAGVQKRAS